jgi:hypothetical protein
MAHKDSHKSRKIAWREIRGIGEILLMSYLLLVIAIALLRAWFGFPTVGQLAASPALLAHGEWWRLATSALVINGPAVPQVLAIGVLGTFTIYFGGSGTFWLTALAGHVLGTLLAYAGVVSVWLTDRAVAAKLLVDPDYGVSLIWCAALGAFAAMSWLGTRGGWRRPVRPELAIAAVATLAIVTLYSDAMAAVQHVLAFMVGVAIVATADHSRILHRDRRPLLAKN